MNPKVIRPVIDRLFPGSVASRLGVQSISIAQGEVSFPVATAGAVFGWQTTELADVGAASEYETSERSLNPDHTGGAQMVISRKALKQAGAGLEAAIRRDLSAAIGAELDRVVINGSGAAGQPLGIIAGAGTYGITSTPVDAAASWSAFRAQVVAFMEANAITSASQVNLGFDPAIWAALDDALIAGTAVSEWDRLTKHVGTPAISNVIPAETAILTANVQGIAPGIKMRWDHFKDGAYDFTQGKTDKPLWIPLTDRLAAYLATVEKKGLTVITDRAGRPSNYHQVRDEMAKIKAAMKYPDARTYVTHGLRKNATIELYQAGCDDELVKAVTGHSGVEMLKKYGGRIR